RKPKKKPRPQRPRSRSTSWTTSKRGSHLFFSRGRKVIRDERARGHFLFGPVAIHPILVVRGLAVILGAAPAPTAAFVVVCKSNIRQAAESRNGHAVAESHGLGGHAPQAGISNMAIRALDVAHASSGRHFVLVKLDAVWVVARIRGPGCFREVVSDQATIVVIQHFEAKEVKSARKNGALFGRVHSSRFVGHASVGVAVQAQA